MYHIVPQLDDEMSPSTLPDRFRPRASGAGGAGLPVRIWPTAHDRSRRMRGARGGGSPVRAGWLVLLAIMLSGWLPAVIAQPAAVTGLPAASATITDIDGDGVADATVVTERTQLTIRSRDGRLGRFHLLGTQFGEDLFPPVLVDHGYSFATATVSGFGLTLYPQVVADGGFAAVPLGDDGVGYLLETAVATDGSTIVTARARGPLVAAGASAPSALPPIGLSRRYRVSPGGYIFELEFEIANLASQPLAFGSDVGQLPGVACHFGPGIFMHPFDATHLIGLAGEGNQSFSRIQDLASAPAYSALTGVGLSTNYFCVLLDAGEPIMPFGTEFEVTSGDPRKKKFTGHLIGLGFKPFLLPPGQTRSFRVRHFVGPKSLDELLVIGRGGITNYGALSTMMLRILQGFHRVFPNYGVAIIMLTVLVRVLLYPLTLSQTRSMAQMQKIQPMLQALKDKYSDNPQKLNEETLKLFQKHQVNPAGGCLPMLLQLPVLIALYNTISSAVELRKVGFLWLGDLSQADPFLILPIAIVATMYFQQSKMKVDPAQQQMMTIMPMFMFVITWSLPAGVLVYWFTSSVIGLFQQVQAENTLRTVKEEPAE